MTSANIGCYWTCRLKEDTVAQGSEPDIAAEYYDKYDHLLSNGSVNIAWKPD
jgi:hypothetical protein